MEASQNPAQQISNSVPFYVFFYLIYFGTIGVMYPYLAMHLQSVGLTLQQISWLYTAVPIAALLTQQVWGYLADLVFTKRQLMMIFSALSGLLFCTLRYSTSPMVLFVYFLLWQSAALPQMQLVTSLVFSNRRCAEHFSFIRAFGSLGFVVTNFYMGWLIRDASPAIIFPFYLGYSALTLLLVYYIRDDSSHPERRPKFWTVQRQFLRRPGVKTFLVLVFLYESVHKVAMFFQTFLIADVGGDASLVGWCFSVGALVEIPVFFLADRLLARWGEVRVMSICAFMQVVRWVLVSNATSPWVIVATSPLHAITFGLFYAASVTYMNYQAGYQLKASAQTLLGVVYIGLAGLNGFLAGGWLVKLFGTRRLFDFAAVGAVLACAIALWLLRKHGPFVKRVDPLEISV
ncbi:MAG: MFS transporter [bacterium]